MEDRETERERGRETETGSKKLRAETEETEEQAECWKQSVEELEADKSYKRGQHLITTRNIQLNSKHVLETKNWDIMRNV